MKIGMLGSGNVGQALGIGFAGLGYQVRMGSRTPDKDTIQAWLKRVGSNASAGTFSEAASFGDLAVFAVRWDGAENAIKLAGPENLAGKVVIDHEELDELIKKIQIALPEEFKQAEWVSREKERYLQQAHEEAKKIIKEAEACAEGLIQQDQIMAKAEAEAERIINEAKRIAEGIESEAKDYAHRVFERLEDSLERTLKVVHQGREVLMDEETY
jgi:Zn-finger nucleic acid-binding protein